MNNTANYEIVSLQDLAPGCGSLVPVTYGIVVPILALFVISVDSVIITVFMRPNVRSHTTFILTLIAVSDIFNIAPPTGIYVFYYTLGNYHHALPYYLCRGTYLLSHVSHDFFHAMSLWLTVLLAFIRSKCLKAPFEARWIHKSKNVVLFVMAVLVLELIVHVPSVFILQFHAVARLDERSNTTVLDCAVSDIDEYSTSRKLHVWSEVIIDSIIPCLLLLYMDVTILRILRKAKQSRNSLRYCRSFRESRSKTTTSEDEPEVDNTPTYTKQSQATVQQNGAQIREVVESAENDGNGCFRYCVSCAKGKSKKHPESAEKDLNKDITRKFCFVKANGVLKNKRQQPSQENRLLKLCRRHYKKKLRLEKQNSEDILFERLNRESRRTSWLILAVALLITTHEIPSAILHVLALVRHSKTTLPFTIFGCWSAVLNLWQHVVYPVIFLIYAWMSSVFRQEVLRVLRCKCYQNEADDEPIRKKVLMSPCSVRKTMSNEQTTMHKSNSNISLEVKSDIDEKKSGTV